jgi:uncharacterized protein YpuA (DUF1002 family)
VADIKLNPNALQKIGEQAKRKTVGALNSVQDDVWRTHAGQPKDKVRTALKTRMTSRGLTPSDEMINQIAEAISNCQRITFR